MRWPMVRSACPPARSASIREHLTNRMSPPRRATWCPSACATWVFPTPEALLGESRCDVTPYRRLRHLDAVVVTQPLRDRGDRHRHLYLIVDPLVMGRDQRPGQR